MVRVIWALVLIGTVCVSAGAQQAQLKGIGRFEGWRDNPLIGYGIVTGLAGSGDSRRSGATRQAMSSVLGRLGADVAGDDLETRNTAAVIVTGVLPASANVGDRLDVTVSSVGDARSLAGGTLLMVPLYGPDENVYALAQGALVTGGFSFESELNLQQRNYPTTALLARGATVERPVSADLLGDDGELAFFLYSPSFTTASRVADRINVELGASVAWAKSADEIRIAFFGGDRELTSFVATLENIAVEPDRLPRIVINERTGTIVAGADVALSSVVVSQGDIRVTVTAESYASQPVFIGGRNEDIQSLIVTNTALSVEEQAGQVTSVFPDTRVADLVEGLSAVGVDTRGIITVLQAVKAAGALHGEIVVQ